MKIKTKKQILFIQKNLNMVQEDIDEITIENNIIQWKKKLEQLEIEYLLCKTSINAYIIEITKNLELMENIKNEKNGKMIRTS